MPTIRLQTPTLRDEALNASMTVPILPTADDGALLLVIWGCVALAWGVIGWELLPVFWERWSA